METTHTETHTETKTRGPAMNALAAVGFIALILLGMGLAIYAARFMPVALSNLGEAAVSLSHIFTPGEGSNVEVVNDSNYPNNAGGAVMLPIGTSTETTTQNPATVPATPAAPTYYAPQPTYYAPQPTYTAVQVPASTNYYGDPDLTIDIVAVGYLRSSNDFNSFVETDRILSNKDGIVKFRVSNRGTDESSRFEIAIKVKTSGGTDTDSVRAPSMRPGTSVVSYGTFDANRSSGNVDITVTVDSGKDVRESNERNNDDSTDVDIRR